MKDYVLQRQFARVYEPERKKMLRLAERRTGNTEDARDVLQSASLFLWSFMREKATLTDAEVQKIFWRIFLNKLTDFGRRHSREGRLFAPESSGTPVTPASCETAEDHLIRQEEAWIFRLSWKQLPAADRSLLYERFENDRKPAEIAENLGTSDRNVYQRIFRAKNRFRKYYTEMAAAEANHGDDSPPRQTR